MKRTPTVWLALVILAAVQAPTALAQVPGPNPVPNGKCTQECYPQDADVNGAGLKRGAATVRTILYGHFLSVVERAPINTQLPDPNKERDVNGAFLMPMIDTNTGVGEADVHLNYHNFVMYSSPGLVEIFDGEWRTHQEPGLAKDVHIASDEIVLYWYMSAHPVPNQNSNDAGGRQMNAAVVPQVGIYARIETGRTPFSLKSTLIAEGDTGKGGVADVAGGPGRVNMISIPGQDPVYEFRVPMQVTPKGKTLPSVSVVEGFVVSVHPYQIRDPVKGNEVMQPEWRLRTGVDFPPRLVFDVSNPMETTSASLSLFNEYLFVRWSLLSPWGSYDTEDKSITATLTGPQPVEPKLTSLVILKRSVDHDGHFKPVNATWKLDYAKANLGDGDYAYKLTITNLQKTYILEEELPFKVVNGVPDVNVVGVPSGKKGGGGPAQSVSDGEGAPGFEPALLAVSLVLVAFARRRPRA